MSRKSALKHFGQPLNFGLSILLLSLLGIGMFSADSIAEEPIIDEEMAIGLVTQRHLGGTMDGIRLYVLPEVLPSNERIATWTKDVFTTNASGWLVFVDRVPGANWEHPCWYFFVDANSGDIQRFDAKTPPMRQAEMTEITQGRDNPAPGLSEASLEQFSQRLRSLPKPGPTRGQAYAFIISGGANQSNNHIRYWNDCAFIYRALVEYYGYADDHIRVCISDGTNPAIDRSDGTNSPADLDGDGDDDIEYPATFDYIEQVFGELATTMTAGDQLFIFTTDHGGQESGMDCYLNLWNSETLRDDQMAGFVNALPCQTITCAFEQCYSGGMIDDLEGDGRVIATAAHWSELSWAMPPDYIYDTFVYHWTCAVSWQTPDGDPVDADSNDDGIVSMHEAFLYAEANDFDDETPQYSSTPSELGDMVNLFGNMDGVYLALNGMLIDDDNSGQSQGNGDGVIDYGETIELTISLENMGLTDAENVSADLVSECAYLSMITGSGNFGNIPSEGSASNTEPYCFTVDINAPDALPLELVLQLSEAPEDISLPLIAAAPSYAVTVHEIIDSGGDGMANPGEDLSITLRIENQGSSQSPDLDAVLQGGMFFQVNGIPHAVAPIPQGESVLVPGYSVHVQADCPEIYTGLLTLAMTGSNSYQASSDVFLMVGPWFDNVETDLGWTLGLDGDDASTGVWEQVDPIGTSYNSQPVQPEDDHTLNPGHICFVTGNGTPGGSAGENDLDGGKTTLLSPVFNLEGATSATISYWRWYTNDLGNNPGQDYWDVDVSSAGMSWVHLEHTMESDNSWTEHSFDLSAYIPFSSEVRFRFVASDEDLNSLVEAAVDDIVVTIVRDTSTGMGDPSQSFSLRLDPCVPNPMKPSTLISFELPSASPTSLKVYDVSGRLVRTLVDGNKLAAGPQTRTWDGRNGKGMQMASGIYFVQLRTPRAEVTRSVALLR